MGVPSLEPFNTGLHFIICIGRGCGACFACYRGENEEDQKDVVIELPKAELDQLIATLQQVNQVHRRGVGFLFGTQCPLTDGAKT